MGTLVWVSQGKMDHPAYIVNGVEPAVKYDIRWVLVEWQLAGYRQWVAERDISHAERSRRRVCRHDQQEPNNDSTTSASGRRRTRSRRPQRKRNRPKTLESSCEEGEDDEEFEFEDDVEPKKKQKRISSDDESFLETNEMISNKSSQPVKKRIPKEGDFVFGTNLSLPVFRVVGTSHFYNRFAHIPTVLQLKRLGVPRHDISYATADDCMRRGDPVKNKKLLHEAMRSLRPFEPMETVSATAGDYPEINAV